MDDGEYYDMLSAFCKSLRGSDSDAALFWCGRMLYAGVDPRIITRRMIVHASEDVGLANPQALQQAVAAAEALEHLGMPEARLNIAQAILFICESPKSDSVTKAVERAFYDAEHSYQQPVPSHLRDTHYSGAEQTGSGIGYLYPHDFPGHYVPQQYLPDELAGENLLLPHAARQRGQKSPRQEEEKKKKGNRKRLADASLFLFNVELPSQILAFSLAVEKVKIAEHHAVLRKTGIPGIP